VAEVDALAADEVQLYLVILVLLLLARIPVIRGAISHFRYRRLAAR
jgi:hypothetical protein